MSYYHIKNINIDKTKNNISADLADSSLYPLTFYNTEFLCQRKTFEETYAEFIYNLVSGNFHPTSNSKGKVRVICENPKHKQVQG